MIRQGRHEIAARLLEQFIRERETSPVDKNRAQVETAYMLLAKLFANRLQLPDQAERWLDRYLQKFPAGRLRDTAERMRQSLVRADAVSPRVGRTTPKLGPPLPAGA